MEAKWAQPSPATPAMVEARRANATKHGAQSEPRIRDAARAQKRKILRRMGRKATDLDVVASVLVDLLARSLAKLALLDAYYARTGIVDEATGEGAPTLGLYFTAHNSARLTAGRLAEHLARQGDHENENALRDYIDANYSRNGDDGG